MFTGIIDHIGTIETSEQRGDLRITVACDFDAGSYRMGESIACSGACLTVIDSGTLASGKSYFVTELSAETVACTAPGRWKNGASLNIERALKAGDALDGHIVTGHVDGIVIVKNVTDSGDSRILEIESPPEFAKFIAAKGSVCLDGISLTVNKVEGRRFWVNIIPHTWRITTLGARKAGDALNLEIDPLARYVARLLQPE